MGVLRLVLFDLDDTLFDHQHSRRSGLQMLQQVYPSLASIPLDTLVDEHERQLNATYDRVLDGQISLATDRLDRFRRLFISCGIVMDRRDITLAMQHYRHTYEEHRRAIAGAASLLAYLKPHVQIGVVTNGLISAQTEKIAACHLEGLIDFVLTSEEAGVKKPDLGIFRRALERTGTRSENTVFVGDSWESDVVGAYRSGIRSLWLNRWQKPCPDSSLTTELKGFEPLNAVIRALYPDSVQ